MPPLTRHHIYIYISTHRVIKLLCSSNNSSCKCILYTPCDILLIHVGKTIINHPPVITIFIGAINHSQMDGSWHCCNHITWANYNNSQRVQNCFWYFFFTVLDFFLGFVPLQFFHGFLQFFHGFLQCFHSFLQLFHGFLQFSMVFFNFPLFSASFPWCSSIFPLVSSIFPGFSSIFPWFSNGFLQVFHGFLQFFHSVLQLFHAFLQFSIVFCKVSLVFFNQSIYIYIYIYAQPPPQRPPSTRHLLHYA